MQGYQTGENSNPNQPRYWGTRGKIMIHSHTMGKSLMYFCIQYSGIIRIHGGLFFVVFVGGPPPFTS